MRLALAVLLLLALGAGCTPHSGECATASVDTTTQLPRGPAATTTGATPRPIAVRFAGVAAGGLVGQVHLLAIAPALDPTTGEPLLDLDRHELLDPDADPASRTAATTVAPVRDFADGAASLRASAWLDQRTRWRDMRGLGIGTRPVLPFAPPGGPFVAIGGATSVVRFPLGDEEPDTSDAGPAVDTGIADAGVVPSVQNLRQWEWPWPALELPATATPDTSPTLADLVVVPRDAPQHDLAIVARTSSVIDGIRYGGEAYLLDVDDRARITLLETTSFDAFADAGLHASAAAFAVYDEHVVLAALDHQTFFSPATYGPGLLAVLDPAMRSVRSVIRIPGMTNCTNIAPYHPPSRAVGDPDDEGEAHRWVLSCLGSVPAMRGATPSDAGFVYVEYDPRTPDRLPSVARTIAATSLGIPRANAGTIPLFGHLVAFIEQGSVTPAAPDRLIVVNVDTGDTQTLHSASTTGVGSVGLGSGAFDPSSGVLVVPNGLDGVLTWHVPRTFARLEGGGHTYVFPSGLEVAVTGSGCARVPMRLVRTVGAGAAAVAPPHDAGMPPTDAGTPPTDSGTPPEDAGSDAGTDGGRDAGADAG